MVVVIWCLGIISLGIIIGEIKYRYSEKDALIKKNTSISKGWEEDVDRDIDDLSIEYTSNNKVQHQILAMRGSWRIAQKQIMESQSFYTILDREYRKKL